MEKTPLQQPLEAMDMHAPIEVTVAVRMTTKDGGTGRVMFDMPPGVYPTRAEIQAAVAPALAMENEGRPMTKPEFVAFITKRATGEAIQMAGEQNFVPAPAEIPHAMLVHAICGAVLKAQFVDEYTERGLRVYIGDRYETRWDRDALDKQPDDVLLAIYQRVTA